MAESQFCRVCGRGMGRVALSRIRDWEYGVPGEYAYLECPGCGLLQLDPFPTVEDLVEAYKVDYHGFAPPKDKGAIYSWLYKLVDRQSMKRLGRLLRQENRVLDVGCGIGLFLDKLRRHGLRDLEGLDFSAAAVEAVRNKGFTCHEGLFLDLEFEAGAYDLIAMNNYLEHTLNPLAELQQARKLLAPGAALVGEVPNYASGDRILFGRYWGGNHVPRHVFQFTPQSLENAMKMAGFKEVRISFPLNTSHFALSMQNFMQRNVPDLHDNTNLMHGRSRHYSVFLLACIPVNALFKVSRMTGFMQFECAS